MSWIWLTVFGLALASITALNVADSSSRWAGAVKVILVIGAVWSAFEVAGFYVGLVLLFGAVAAAEVIRFAQRRRRLA